MALLQRLPHLGRKPLLTGLDVGSHSIKLVRLKARRGGYQLVNFGVMPLPARAIGDQTVRDEGSVVTAIRNLLRMEKISARDTAVALSGQAVLTKTLRLPRMRDKELAEAMQWEAEPHVPFDMADVNLDFRVLPSGNAAGGQMDVLLVAARKARVAERRLCSPPRGSGRWWSTSTPWRWRTHSRRRTAWQRVPSRSSISAPAR